MSKNYLTEAFKEMELLEESKSFSFNKQGAEDLSGFLEDDTLDDFEVVIDPEATNEDELQDSYIGKVILGCDVCHSMIYKAPEDIVIDKTSQMANVGELCPYCFTGDGYKVIGKVAPYKEITVETPSDKNIKVKVDGKVIDNDPETEEDRDDLDEEIQPDQKYPVKSPISESIKGNKEKIDEELTNMEKIMRAFPEIGSDEPVTEDVDDTATDEEKIKVKFSPSDVDDEDLDEAIEKDQKYPVKSPISESMEDISITTEDTVIKVKATPRADKETIEPVTEEEVAEMQLDAEQSEEEEVEEAPVEEISETEGETETSSEGESEEAEVEMEEIDEEGVNELGEAYLKQVYENVNSFKTSKAILKKDKMIIEGVIIFNSGKKAKTQFLFEAKEMTRKGKLKFLGENKNISKNKKAFTLTGNVNGKKLMVESLNYNYSSIDSKTNKPKRLYGTVRVTK